MPLFLTNFDFNVDRKGNLCWRLLSMNIRNLEFDISNARKLPCTMLGMENKLKTYQRNLINKRNELRQLKDNGQDERSLDKRIACVEGMIDFWYRRNMALRNGNMMWFPAEDAAFDRANESSLRENINVRSVDENRDFGNVVSRKHFRDLREYGRKSVSKFDDFYQANTELHKLGRINRDFIELIDSLEIIHSISGSPEPYYDECTLQVPFINLVENIKNDLRYYRMDIFELKESAKELIDDRINILDENAWNFIFNFFYSEFTYHEPQSQDHGWWEIDGKPFTQIFEMITDDHVNAVRLIAREIRNLNENKEREKIHAIVKVGNEKGYFGGKIIEMNEELKRILYNFVLNNSFLLIKGFDLY